MYIFQQSESVQVIQNRLYIHVRRVVLEHGQCITDMFVLERKSKQSCRGGNWLKVGGYISDYVTYYNIIKGIFL